MWERCTVTVHAFMYMCVIHFAVKDDSGTEEYEESIDGGKEAVEATKSAALITPEEDEDIPLDIKVESQEGDDTDARGDAQMDDEEGSTAGADDEDEDDDDDNDDDAAEFSSNSLMKVEVEPVDSAQPSTSGTAGDEAEKVRTLNRLSRFWPTDQPQIICNSSAAHPISFLWRLFIRLPSVVP